MPSLCQAHFPVRRNPSSYHISHCFVQGTAGGLKHARPYVNANHWLLRDGSRPGGAMSRQRPRCRQGQSDRPILLAFSHLLCLLQQRHIDLIKDIGYLRSVHVPSFATSKLSISWNHQDKACSHGCQTSCSPATGLDTFSANPQGIPRHATSCGSPDAVCCSQGGSTSGGEHRMRWRPVWSRLAGVLLTLALLLAGCTSGGDEGQATAPSAPSPRVERQALANLLALYQEAVVAEDSDRLQALLAPATVLARPRPPRLPCARTRRAPLPPRPPCRTRCGPPFSRPPSRPSPSRLRPS